MKTVRILVMLALCGAANVSQAMWLRAGKAIASRLAAKAFKPVQQTARAAATPQYKPMASLRTSLLNSFRNKRSLAGFALFGASTGAASYAYQHKTSQELGFAKKNGTIAIKSLAGTINVEGWDQDRLEIKTCKEADSQEALDRSTISTRSVTRDEIPLFTTIEDKIKIDGNEYSVEDNLLIVRGNEGPIFADKSTALIRDRKWAARIRYDIRAPRYSNLIIQNIAGNIALTGIFGSVDANTWTGNIETKHCNNIRAHTASGNVTLEQSYGTVHAESMSGNVSITNNQMALDEIAKNGLNAQGFTLDLVTAKSMSGNATVSGALKGKASSIAGKATFNGQTGSSIWWE